MEMKRIVLCVILCLFCVYYGVNGRRRDIGAAGESVADLLENYPFNKYLKKAVPKPFQIVTPKIVTKQGLEPVSTRDRELEYRGLLLHMQQVTIQIIIDKKKHKLKLERNNDLFSAGIQVKHFQDKHRQEITKSVENCYYQGVVKRDDWSAVAVSTCNGVRGVIQLNNETYLMQPLDNSGQEGADRPHIIYKATSSETETCGNDHGKWLPFHELHKGRFLPKMKLYNYKKARNQTIDTAASSKYLKLALVLDHSMYWYLNLTVGDLFQHTALTANMVDMYYRELNVRVALNYVELWNLADRIRITERLRETMENFLEYKNKHLKDIDEHSTHLLTRRMFEDRAVGMAIPDSICTGRAAGINLNPSYLEPQKGATILAHMIGHNLGIKHDEDGGCECNDDYGCIMSTQVLAGQERHSRMFSSCSVKDWEISLNMGIAACLTEQPQESFPQTCGNKHVERGEECDCGTPEECALTDPCCDANTCLLKYWAQCRTGACCHNCTYLSPDYMCRNKSTDCDVPEFCTGNSGQCPPNNYAMDGHSCNNHTGYCMGGVCPTLDKQCQHIWGDVATQAKLQCFERFNPTGNFNGHCGKDASTGSFSKCLPEDIQCGLLHCHGGNKIPLFGPGKDSTRTTFFSNGQEYECKTVHGPSTLELPNLGIVLDGTRCGDDKVCMNKKCVPLSNLAPLTCPGSVGRVGCSGHGVCTKDDVCFCEAGWGGADCMIKLNTTRVILSIDMLTSSTPVAMTTVAEVNMGPGWDVTGTTPVLVTTDKSGNAVVQANEAGWMNTQWMMIILASVIVGLALLLGLSFCCYRRQAPSKFSTPKKKKKYVHHCEEGEVDSANKLIKFGSTPSYRDEKKKKKKNLKKSKKGDNKYHPSDSDLELPPPPVIVSDPGGAKPEKGILKSAYSGVRYANDRRSSESNTATSSGRSHDSVGPYDEIDEDTEAGEIQDIFGNCDEPEKSLDALDNMIESSSFDFMLPTPFGNMNMSGLQNLQNRSPSPTRKFIGYDIPMSNLSHGVQRPNHWKSSPPKSRVLRMRNLDELLQTIDRNTIDLSPSPDDPPVQISPSTSEDVRSSSTEDRHYTTSSHDPQSPNSTTSGSTCTALRPLLGSQWSKYVLHRNANNAGGNFTFDDIESPLPHINIPPPMNPINIRSIFNYGQKGGVTRDNNDTPLGSQNGECSSNNGTANSRNGGYEKSSGYGSEHDQERFSLEDISRNQSRSGSASPPNFSAVIRTGPNQIKLVPGGKQGGYSYNPMDNDLQKLLDGVPRIDAGCYERSPIQGAGNNMGNMSSGTGTCSSITSGTSTLDTLKNSDYPSSGINSETNTLVNSEYETMERYNNCEDSGVEPCEHYSQLGGENTMLDANTNSDTVGQDLDYSRKGGEVIKHPLPELPNGLLPNPKPLEDIDQDVTGSAPCIDRSLEEISQIQGQGHKNRQGHRNTSKSNRPLSLSLGCNEDLGDGLPESDPLLVNRFSAIDPVAVDICEC